MIARRLLVASSSRPSQARLMPSQAQAWPTRQPIRVIVALTAGSAIDIVARLVFEQVSKQIGQTIVIENRSGASQTLGAGAVAKADPDGYTILVAGSALAVVPSTMANLPFNVQSDLTAVGSLANVPLVMVVQPAKGYKTIHDFVAAAKAKPGTHHLRFGRTRRRDPSGRGTLPARRGLRGTLRAVPRRARGVDRSDGGTARFLHVAGIARDALITGGKLQALAVASATRGICAAGHPDDDRSGLRQFRLRVLGRRIRPRRDAARDRGSPEPGDPSRRWKRRACAIACKSMGGSPTPMTAQAFGEQFKREVGVNAGLVKAVGLQTN